MLEYINDVIRTNKIVVFMKGDKIFPRCGFSATVVNILEELNVEFLDIDVLSDDALRQAIKEYSNWPTLPQLYINNEFIGGCDIVQELYYSGELLKLIN